MKRLLIVILILLVLGAGYLLAWPVPIKPVAWSAPTAPEYKGTYAPNNYLADFTAVDIEGLHGPEAIVANADGELFTATHEGWILRWQEDAIQTQRWLNVGGRPLGIAFDNEGNLWVANAFIGLQKVTPQGEISLELDTAEGVGIRYADDVVVAPNGKVYFSDASTHFGAKEIGDTLAASLLDILEHDGNGRIIEFDPISNQSKVIMQGLSFANGVTIDKLGQFMLVCETGSYRVWKHWLNGAKAGQSEIIIDNLPGFPDNIHRGLQGRYWLGFASPRSTILDQLSASPFKRKIVQRLPQFMRPQVQFYGHVIAVDANGQVLASLQDPQGAYPTTTGVWETDDYLFVSSLQASVLARIEKSKVGL